MPTHRRTREHSKHVLLLAALAAGGAAVAADPPPLPEDFLEYLGSWEADDSDWLVANAAAIASAPTASNAGANQTNPTTTEKRGAAQLPATTEHKP
jgi:hypothetical protein